MGFQDFARPRKSFPQNFISIGVVFISIVNFSSIGLAVSEKVDKLHTIKTVFFPDFKQTGGRTWKMYTLKPSPDQEKDSHKISAQ